jgi:hypothetical protein
MDSSGTYSSEITRRWCLKCPPFELVIHNYSGEYYKEDKNVAFNMQLQGIKLEGLIECQNSLKQFQQFSGNIIVACVLQELHVFQKGLTNSLAEKNIILE